jgi:hypothetical protein
MRNLAAPPDKAVQRQDIVRGRSGRPNKTAPLPIGTEQGILEAGYAKATGPHPPPGEMQPPEISSNTAAAAIG